MAEALDTSPVKLNHLLGLEGVRREAIVEILDTADAFLDVL